MSGRVVVPLRPDPEEGSPLFTDPQEYPTARTTDPDPAMPSSARPRRQNSRKPLPLPWRPARWVELRTAGTGTERVPADAVAIERDWVTIRHTGDGRPRVTACPAWRVTEIELKEMT